MRNTILLLTLVACGSGDIGRHDEVPCSVAGAGGTFTTCEVACVNSATLPKAGFACTGVNPHGAPTATQESVYEIQCPVDTVKMFGDTAGCCVYDGAPGDDDAVLRFFECVGE